MSGRPAPWMGQKIKGDGQNMMARSGENRDSGFRSRQGPNAPVLTEGRSLAAGLDKRLDPGKKPTEDGKRKSDVSTLDFCKRSRDKSLVSTRRLGDHPLLLDRVNRKEEVESFWDSSDFGVCLRKGSTIVGDYDLGHFIPHSSDVLLQSIALNSCQVLYAVRALLAQGDKFRVNDVKLCKDLAKLEEDAYNSEVSASKANEEIQRLESVIVNLKEEVHLLQEISGVMMKENEGFRDELRVLYENHHAELQLGGQFLASYVGLELQKNLAEKVVESFRSSAAFEDDVYCRAYTIHYEVVLDCRHILREKLFPTEIVMLIGPEVPDIDENVFDAQVADAPLGDFEDIEIIESLNSLQDDDAPDIP